MALIRTINWPATVAAVQAVLDGPPVPTQATLTSGVLVRNAVTTAGATYDTNSNDGILNQTPYALSIQAWAATTAPAWVEMDRVCRAVYKLLPPPSILTLACFGMSGVPPWRKGTAFVNASPNGAVVPTVSNGFTYICATTGVTDSTEPAWQTELESEFRDGTVVWQCTAVLNPGTQPAALPWDTTLQAYVSLANRTQDAALIAVVSPGLASLVAGTTSVLAAALAAQPASNPAADAASRIANNALNTAITNANAWIAAAAIT